MGNELVNKLLFLLIIFMIFWNVIIRSVVDNNDLYKRVV